MFPITTTYRTPFKEHYVDYEKYVTDADKLLKVNI